MSLEGTECKVFWGMWTVYAWDQISLFYTLLVWSVAFKSNILDMREHCYLKDWLYCSLSTPLVFIGVSFFLNKILLLIKKKSKISLSLSISLSPFFCWVSVYAGTRTPELKVTGKTGYHLGQQTRFSISLSPIKAFWDSDIILSKYHFWPVGKHFAKSL